MKDFAPERDRNYQTPPDNWMASVKVRSQLQRILNETEEENRNMMKEKQIALQTTGHCHSGGCISRIGGHQARLACQGQNKWLDLKYLFMMSGREY